MSGNIPQSPRGTGMASPAVPFVDLNGNLLPLSFRFLMELWKGIGQLGAGTRVGAATHTGTSTTDGTGHFTATWDAFPVAFGSFTISTTDPAYPGGVFTPATITLGSYSGILSRSDNQYPTPITTVLAGVTFGWIVSGY